MSMLCEMSSSTGGGSIFDGTGSINERVQAALKPSVGQESLEAIVGDLKRLEVDKYVRLADEEAELREALMQIRDGLREKQARGRKLEAMGITFETVRRYRKDYAETDWGAG